MFSSFFFFFIWGGVKAGDTPSSPYQALGGTIDIATSPFQTLGGTL